MEFNDEDIIRILALTAVLNNMDKDNGVKYAVTVGDTLEPAININKTDNGYYVLNYVVLSGRTKDHVFSELDDLANHVLSTVGYEKHLTKLRNEYSSRVSQYHIPIYFELVSDTFNKYVKKSNIDNGANVYKKSKK